MKNRYLKISTNLDFYQKTKRNEITFCTSGIQEYTKLTREEIERHQLWLVATEKKNAISFKLKWPIGIYSRQASIVGIDTYKWGMLHSTGIKLGNLYTQGYRYIHLEYEEQKG